MKRGTVRTAPALLLIAGLSLASLTACAPAEGCAPSASAGPATDLVHVTGELDAPPKVDFPTPVASSKTQSDAVIVGDGIRLTGNEYVVLNFTVFNGRTGKLIEQTSYDDSVAPVSQKELIPGLAKAVKCQTVGSRVVSTLSAADAFGPQGGAPQFDIKADDTLIAVIDISRGYLPKADGYDVPIVEPGFPSVVTAADGTPGLTIPKSDPPTTLKVATTKQGSGPKVEEDSRITFHYVGALWKERTIFQSSWEEGKPGQAALNELVKGMRTALLGKQVGSQILVVIPPELAYGPSGAGSTIPPNATVIFVVDILGVD